MNIESREIVLWGKNKGADQLHAQCAADMRLCIPYLQKSKFSHVAGQISAPVHEAYHKKKN